MIKITCTEAPIFAQIVNRNFVNITRVSRLLDDFTKSLNQDILRLCVVYLHASSEDLLRNVYFYHITNSDHSNLLGKIPLFESDGKKEKFNFQDLKYFKNYTIEEIMNKSCEEYANRLTFNNTNDIISVFNKFNVSTEKIKHLLPQVQEIFLRRHLIVHNLDMNTNRFHLSKEESIRHDGKIETKDNLNKAIIENWINIMSQFMLKTAISFLPKGTSITMNNI